MKLITVLLTFFFFVPSVWAQGMPVKVHGDAIKFHKDSAGLKLTDLCTNEYFEMGRCKAGEHFAISGSTNFDGLRVSGLEEILKGQIVHPLSENASKLALSRIVAVDPNLAEKAEDRQVQAEIIENIKKNDNGQIVADRKYTKESPDSRVNYWLTTNGDVETSTAPANN